MLYLVAQIVLCLLFTFVIGISVGWLMRGLGTSRHTETVEARWRARLVELERAIASPSATGNDNAGRVAALEKQIRERDEKIAALQARQGIETPPTGQPSGKPAEQFSRLQGHLADQRAAADRLEGQLERAAGEKELLVQRLRDRESEIGRMSQERQHAINTIAGLQKELRTQRGRQLRSSDEAVPAVDETQTEPDAGGAEPPAAAPDQRQRDLPMPGTTQPAVKKPYEPAWRLAAPRGSKDNLQAIFGIGPKLERQLNELGVFHFEQIAGFGKDDILWVARHLQSFPGRIVRDRWIQQAQSLAERDED